MEATPRNLEIIEGRKQEKSLKDLGDKYGISRERVRQIVRRLAPEIDTRAVTKRRHAMAQLAALSNEQARRERALALPEHPFTDELADPPTARLLGTAWALPPIKQQPEMRKYRPWYNLDALIEAIKWCAADLGATYVGPKVYNKWRKGRKGLPSSATIAGRAGTWRKLAVLAGLTPTAHQRTVYPCTKSDEDRLRTVRKYVQFCKETNTRPGAVSYKAWSVVEHDVSYRTLTKDGRYMKYWLLEVAHEFTQQV